MGRILNNFLRGAGSLLDIWPEPTRYAFIPAILARDDGEATWSDWEVVGLDMQRALGQITVGGEAQPSHDPTRS